MSVPLSVASSPRHDANNVRSADRVQKLKDARSEAEKEIEQYKKMKEQEFKAFEDSVRPHLHPALPTPNCSLPL